MGAGSFCYSDSIQFVQGVGVPPWFCGCPFHTRQESVYGCSLRCVLSSCGFAGLGLVGLSR
jgi:hypothetical protein